MIFDKYWFIKHQSILLKLSNSYIGRKIFKIETDKRIELILPNALFWKKGRKYVAEFRTHDKYGKRLYYAFKPLWHLFHFWDILFYPVFNLGFDTLTTYPAAGAVSPVDGWVGRTGVNETYSTILAGAGVSFQTIDAGNTLPLLTASATTNQFASNDYGIYCFDTSSLGASANISSVLFSLFYITPGATSTALGTPDIHIAGCALADTSTISTGDYANIPHTSFGSITWANATAGSQYVDWTLNATGISNTNKTGVSQFSTQFNWSITGTFDGTWVSGGTTMPHYYYADQTGTTNDPKLVVTFTTGGGGIITPFFLKTLS